ncbi:MAG TPA: hypothetical protein PKD96_01735 [Candidatus Absconditabacterales bacterium]|nr:hypothetical protein [Candidatus Absconditabacterales bacterium]HMT26999.1 hypothetical protein [Candidatus Absconditabacterales bacterium]
MKKLLNGSLIALALAFFATAVTSAQTSIQPNQGFGTARVQGLGVAGTDQVQGEGLLTVITNLVNWVLGILSLITLIILLYGGFNMVTAAGDDGKYNEGFKILKQAGIGLAFIALAWFFISLVFFVLDFATQ